MRCLLRPPPRNSSEQAICPLRPPSVAAARPPALCGNSCRRLRPLIGLRSPLTPCDAPCARQHLRHPPAGLNILYQWEQRRFFLCAIVAIYRGQMVADSQMKRRWKSKLQH
ncbi:hypothetical protein BS78_07G117600 [Paspalum vaginatum]|nr:hypothetical protein BS78_07G117600 [Paspalum vaginatum]